jgi:hypothetical protein
LNASQSLVDRQIADFDLRVGRSRPDEPFVVRSVGSRLIRTLDPLVGDEQAPLMEDPDRIGHGLDLDSPPDPLMRNGVAVGLESHQAVAGDSPNRSFLQSIGRLAAMIDQQRFLRLEHLGRPAMGRAVKTLVRGVCDPFGQDRVEMGQAFELLAPQEPLHILDAGFDLALGLRPVGLVRTRPEPVVPAEVPKRSVPLDPRAFEVAFQDDAFEVIVDDLMGDAAEVVEGLDMGADERGHLLVLRPHGIHPPAEAQGHDEQVSLDPFARQDRPALTPVDLTLAAGRRLEPRRRLREGLGPQRANEAADDVVTPGVALLPDLLEHGHRAVAHRRQPILDEVEERGQELATGPLPAIGIRDGLPQDGSNRLDVKPQGSGDALLGLLELVAAVDLVPELGLDHVSSSRAHAGKEDYRIGIHLGTPPEGGDFSVPTGGDYCTPTDRRIPIT